LIVAIGSSARPALATARGGHFSFLTFAYNSLSRKLAMTDQDMGAWSCAYDAVENLTKR